MSLVVRGFCTAAQRTPAAAAAIVRARNLRRLMVSTSERF
jgi:hypothetical protein